MTKMYFGNEIFLLIFFYEEFFFLPNLKKVSEKKLILHFFGFVGVLK